ncbi:MAG: glycerate kinase [Planctomycetota bacterium]|nr:MAG: glycerate kinase [Planctomycetota bacterium]
MKIIIAMDSFKGTLSANQACEIVAESIAECVPSAEVVIKPMADGGEGTAQAMIKAAAGQWIPQRVMGPLPDMQVEAGFAWFNSDKTALVEMASASGLELLSKDQMNPLRTTTYGTGQLIKAALEYGAHKILLAVGGSATVDCGLGAAMALGWEFLDSQGNMVPLGGEALEKVAKIIEPEKLELVPVEVLCDVDNPLCGEHGAARIYGPQKGATPKMVEQLEKGLWHLSVLAQEQLARDINNVPGAGAAGGLAAGALAFVNAALVSGIETVMARSNLRAELPSADWIITGEGCFDNQSLYGKVVSGIANLAAKSHTRIAVIAGEVLVLKQEYQKLGIATAVGCRTKDMSLDYALANSCKLLRSAAQHLAREYLAM